MKPSFHLAHGLTVLHGLSMLCWIIAMAEVVRGRLDSSPAMLTALACGLVGHALAGLTMLLREARRAPWIEDHAALRHEGRPPALARATTPMMPRHSRPERSPSLRERRRSTGRMAHTPARSARLEPASGTDRARGAIDAAGKL